jgi:hypothetical protein
MSGFNLRITILALGVLFGYGSAVAHLVHHRGEDWHHRGHCEESSAKD